MLFLDLFPLVLLRGSSFRKALLSGAAVSINVVVCCVVCSASLLHKRLVNMGARGGITRKAAAALSLQRPVCRYAYANAYMHFMLS